MTIHIYAQHTTRAGHAAEQPVGDDTFTLTGTASELLDYAMISASRRQSFDWTVARTILGEMDDAPQTMQDTLTSLGANQEELEWAWCAEEYHLLKLARGDWSKLIPAIKREMCGELA